MSIPQSSQTITFSYGNRFLRFCGESSFPPQQSRAPFPTLTGFSGSESQREPQPNMEKLFASRDDARAAE